MSRFSSAGMAIIEVIGGSRGSMLFVGWVGLCRSNDVCLLLSDEGNDHIIRPIKL